MDKYKLPNTITARASHAPATPRKANLILESLIGQKPQDAINELQLLSKRAAQPIIKLIKQALGNAADQHKLTSEDLVIEKAFATKGRVLKFVRFAGRGKVKPYQKIASHLTIILKGQTLKGAAPAAGPLGHKAEGGSVLKGIINKNKK